jgi:hypothetical protein
VRLPATMMMNPGQMAALPFRRRYPRYPGGKLEDE